MRKSLLLLLNVVACCAVWAQVEANPGRPTVATPATLTPQGYLQFETGVLIAEHSDGFANRTGLNEVIKFAPTRRLEVLLQAEPFVHTDAGPTSSRDPGDIFAGVQAVVIPGHERRPTVSLSYFRRIYSGAASDIDIGSNRQSALLLVSTDIRKFHFDINAFFTEQVENATHRAQFGQTISVARPVLGRLAFTAELWHFTQPFQRSNTVGLLVAPTYTIKPNLVVDVGFSRGFTYTSTRWEAFFGFTYLLPKKLF